MREIGFRPLKCHEDGACEKSGDSRPSYSGRNLYFLLINTKGVTKRVTKGVTKGKYLLTLAVVGLKETEKYV